MARCMLSPLAWAIDAPQLRRDKMTHRSKSLLGAFLATTVLGIGATAYSQTAGSPWEASQLPETRGIIKQYTLTPRGDVDGLDKRYRGAAGVTPSCSRSRRGLCSG